MSEARVMAHIAHAFRLNEAAQREAEHGQPAHAMRLLRGAGYEMERAREWGATPPVHPAPASAVILSFGPNGHPVVETLAEHFIRSLAADPHFRAAGERRAP